MAQNIIRGASRLRGFDKPTVWSVFTPLAIQTKSVNLGQGFPSWDPPQFFLDAFNSHIKKGPHQYTRAFGIPPLVETLAKFYSPIFNQKINPMSNVCVSAGAVACINAAILGLVEPGDEVICLDPSYDCYQAQIQMAGGITRSVPLKYRSLQSKSQILKRSESDYYQVLDTDKWEIDWDLLKQTLNNKTKAIIVNTPHNPTGKVFTQSELEQLADMLQQYPNIFVLEDGVYEGTVFNNMKPFELPRMAKVKNMWNRTVSIYSAGKLFSMTGIRVGWAIGPQHLIQSLQSFHQYNIFCMYGPAQEAVAEALNKSMTNTYFSNANAQMIKRRNYLMDQLLASKYDFNLWMPEGGYFLLADISNIQFDEKYLTDEKTGEKYTRDYAFCIYMCKEKGVVAIPCSVFYDQSQRHKGENLVRFAFCKDLEIIQQAGRRLSK